MNVYVVFKGEYSAKHIVAITLDKEKADKLAKYHSGIDEDAYVEDYKIDETPDSVFEHSETVYSVRIEKDGESLVIPTDIHHGDKPYEPKFWMTFTAYLTAKDEEHALKIARDMRAKMLAEMIGL